MIKLWNIQKIQMQKLKCMIVMHISIRGNVAVTIANAGVTGMLLKSTLTNI